jgi:hypothetical protein
VGGWISEEFGTKEFRKPVKIPEPAPSEKPGGFWFLEQEKVIGPKTFRPRAGLHDLSGGRGSRATAVSISKPVRALEKISSGFKKGDENRKVWFIGMQSGLGGGHI